MRSPLRRILLLMLLLLGLPWNAYGAEEEKGKEFGTTPITNDGKKWRIGYLQGGPYLSYHDSIKATVRGLMELGWIEQTPLPEDFDKDSATDKLWQWMGSNLKSKYIEFVQDAFWNPNRDEKLYPKVRQEVLDRLNQKKDIDLMLAMGTWAGQALANDEHSTPTVIGSTTDPLAAKIIPSAEDSGRDHIHARIDPTRHEQQTRLFHDIIGFKKLGVVYEDSEEGLNFAGISSVQTVAQERGFEIVRCYARYNGIPKDEATANVQKCHEELVSQVDALYIARHPGVTIAAMPKLLAPLIENKIPTFAQAGSDEVANGVLLSIANSRLKYVGQFYAKTMAKIFNGAKPRQLPQIFKGPPKIAINLETAKRIGYDPPIDILGAADEIYQQIGTTK